MLNKVVFLFIFFYISAYNPGYSEESADLDGNQKVDAYDLLHFINQWHIPAPTPLPTLPPQGAYTMAVLDASTTEPHEISTHLTPLIESTEGLLWKGEPGNRKILVVNWSSWAGYNSHVGEVTTTTRHLWVTVAPQVQEFVLAHDIPDASLVLRIRQLLGLPPEGYHRWFVELWVNPNDLFRPCPDPEITDRECELDLPAPSQFISVATSHQDWYFAQKAGSYGQWPYPWTRLGYTYDWGNPENHVGLSEYVLHTGAEVEIQSASETFEYFGRAPSAKQRQYIPPGSIQRHTWRD